MFSIGLLLDEVSVEKYICEYVGNFQGTFSSFLQAAAPACFVFLFSKKLAECNNRLQYKK